MTNQQQPPTAPERVDSQLLDRLQSYSQKRISLIDDSEVYELVMNLPIVRELQNHVSRLRGEVSAMQEMRRFLESYGDGFCVMWREFKELTKGSEP